MSSLMAAPLSAQQREWTGNDGKTTFRAELVNAYDGTAYFQKENLSYIRVPLLMLAPYDLARVLDWSAKRDAQAPSILMNCNGVIAEDIKKQWPNKVSGTSLKDADINNTPTPRLFVFLMVKGQYTAIADTIKDLVAVEKNLNAAGTNFIQVVVISSFEGDNMGMLQNRLGKGGADGWLMPNEWQFKDKKELWASYWRRPDINMLVLDPNGTVLCDGSTKELDGKDSDPIAFLEGLVPTAKRIAAGGPSTPNPMVNAAAMEKLIADLKSKPEGNPAPQAAVFDLSGIDPEMVKQMEGKSFQVEIRIGTDGRVKGLKMKAGGDATEEEALVIASQLWQFIPVIKNGVAEEKVVIAPIRVKPPKKAE